MAMVRRGVMFSLRLASCCMVEVVKGGAGERCLSLRLTEVTVKVSFSTWAMMASTAASVGMSAFLPFLP